MKFLFTLLLFFLSVSFIHAQSLTGVWRGNFYSGSGFYRQQYKYEVQVDQAPNKGLKGVTYSYRTTVFYGKAALQGIFMDQNKSIIFKETQMLDLKIADQSVPCLMTCYLDYYKAGNTEVMEGTFTSVNASNGQDCGSGNVYLEKVKESDFEKEDFLIDKKPPVDTPEQNNKPPEVNTDPPVVKNNPPVVKAKPRVVKTSPDPNIKRLQTVLGITPDGIAGTHTTAVLKSKIPAFTGKITPGNADSLAEVVVKNKTPQTTVKKTVIPPTKKPNNATGVNKNPPVTKNQPQKDTITKLNPGVETLKPPVTQEITKKPIPVPEVIKERENPLIKTIITNSTDITVQLYDNGDVDGDTITVYDNNEVIAYRKGLTAQPVTIHIKAGTDNAHHEFIMVANNLGTIPPNTALMVITTGGKRYELFISEDEKKNSKVVIDYKAPKYDTKQQ